VGLYAAVEGPTLLNGFSVHRSTRPDSIARTDAEGRFNLALRRAGRYYFVADADGFPSKEVGPFRIEIDSRLEETILLQRAGALRVTVRSPDAGRETTGAVVGISRGDGRGLTRRCGAEGSVLFEGLAPGPWLARIVEKEIVLGVELVQPDPTGPKQVPTNCVVRSGEVTEFELQSGEEELSECVLAGRLRINGKPAEGWIAYLRANDRFLGDPAPLSGGVFQVGADRAGPYGVLLRGPEGRMILDTVELVPGQQTWALEIELAAWEAPALPTPEEGMLVVHEWARGQVRFWTPLLSGLSATPLAALRVPAGPGRILQYAAGRSLESQTPVVIALVEASPRED
jgi:hypothetical protein